MLEKTFSEDRLRINELMQLLTKIQAEESAVKKELRELVYKTEKSRR